MITSHQIKVEKTAHYYTLGQATKSTKRFWIICHGYGQRANRFLEQFQLLDVGTNFILAPEGLHRFYWQGMSGDVAASWMTKEDRLDEIADYSNYIHTLYKQFTAQMSADVEIILFGFSQGCATQCRWIANVQPHFHHLVLWAGLLPEDIDYLSLQSYFKDKQIHFVYGNEDQYLKKEYLEKQASLAKAQQLNIDISSFDGKHETRKKTLVEFAERLERDGRPK